MKLESVARGRHLPLATLFVLALVVVLPLWGPGFLNTRGGGDSPFLLARTHQLTLALQDRHFPVRWMPDAAYGLGFPFFSYYGSLPYYLAAVLNLIGLDLLASVKLTQTVFSVAAALGFYGWARGLFKDRLSGWMAAVAYSLAPYHLVNLYVRGDVLSEFSAFAFYPLVLWGLDRLLRRPTALNMLPLALSYAGLVMTHNTSALIFTAVAVIYALASILRTAGQRSKCVLYTLGAWLLGLALSAWFWLPALTEVDLVQLTAQTSGYFFYGNHFRGSDLVQRTLVFDYGIGDGSTPFAMGAVQAAVTLLGVAVTLVEWVRRRRIDWPGLVGVVGLAASTLMISPASRPLWDNLPLLPLVQFPWRFLSVQALFAAIVVGALIRSWPRVGLLLAAALTTILVATGLGGLRPDYLAIGAADVTVDRLQLYELFTGNIGSTIRYEYLPQAAVPRPWTGPQLFDPQSQPIPLPIEGELLYAREVDHAATRREWEVEAAADGATVAFPVYYWPGWRAAVDGEPVQVAAAADSGLLAVPVGSGRHTISLWLGRSSVRTVSEFASLLSLAVVTVVVLIGVVRKGWLRAAPNREGLALAVAGVSVLALLVVLSPRVPALGDTDLTMDFDQMPLLHHNPAGVDFGPVRLLGYEYSVQQVSPGDALTLRLDWEGELAELTLTASLVSPAMHLFDAPAEWAQVEVPLQDAREVTLQVPEQCSPGLALVTLEVEGIAGVLPPRSPAGRTLGRTYLRPIWIAAGAPAPAQILAEFAGGAINLHSLQVSQVDSQAISIDFEWSAARAQAGNLGLSLRLTDPAGNEWGHIETQPGYGFLPTSLWSVGDLIFDRISVPLLPGIPPGDEYTLDVALYRVATWEGVGSTTTNVSIPDATLDPQAPVLSELGAGLALSSLEDLSDQVRQGDTLRWTAYWSVLEQPSAVAAVWRLEGPATISVTLPLAPGSDPGSWPPGAWVAGRGSLDIPSTTPPGSYELGLMLIAADGASLGSYTVPQPVVVEGRERVWDLPPMEHRVDVDFGGLIRLAGYDLELEDESMHITLHWQALDVPERHYMFFVHVADPLTAQPVTQADTMPLGFTYPTGLWVTGEVVSDQIALSLTEVPSGEYEIAVGWFDPDTRVRLEGRDREGNVVPDGRLVLELITVP